MILTGMWRGQITGPYFLKHNITGEISAHATEFLIAYSGQCFITEMAKHTLF